MALVDAVAVFRKFDADDNGTISADELHFALQQLGMKPDTFAQTKETLHRYDRDGDGSLQLDEFLTLIDDVQKHFHQRR